MLSEHFSFDEFVVSQMASRRGIDNTPPDAVIRNLIITAKSMEGVRTFLGGLPITITSGFRCPELNRLIGGADDSAHLRGQACDFICPRFGYPQTVCQYLIASPRYSALKFDQLIFEWSWVHIAFTPEPRGMVLTRNEHGYSQGLVV